MFKKDNQDKIALVSFALICAVLYFNSLRNSFMFDDLHMIRDNAYIKDLRYLPEFFKGYFSSFPVPKGMFRPVLMSTFSLNYLFSGLSPLGYHIFNVLLHFLNGVLLYSLIRLVFPKSPFGLAVIVTSLFLAHPINVEAVSYIASRSDLLVTVFLLSGVLSYIKKKHLLTFLFYFLALLSKETAICFWPLVILYDVIYGGADRDYAGAVKSRIKNKAAFYAGLAVLTIVYLFYRKMLFGGVGNIYPVRSLYSNVLTQSAVTLYYIRLFLFPAPLSVHHNLPILRSLSDPWAIIGVSGVVLIIMLILVFRKKQALVSFGLGWFLICLAPKFYGTLNFVASEHHFYSASIGIYLILAVLTCKIYLAHRRYFIYCAVALIGVCVILAIFRNFEWKDGITLWRVEAKRSPRSALVHNNLGYEYLRAGLYPEAQAQFEKVLTLPVVTDTKISVGLNIASILRIKGEYDGALAELEKVRKRNPDYAGVYNEIGIVYESMGKFEDAEKAFQEGLRLYPGSPHFNTNLGFLYAVEKRSLEAKAYFEKAIKCDPDFSLAYYGLGQVLEVLGDLRNAIKNYQKSIRLDPAYVKAHYALGTLYAMEGNGNGALRELKETVRLEPFFAAAYNNLAVLYASMEPARMELAREYARKAVLLGYKVEDEFLRTISAK